MVFSIWLILMVITSSCSGKQFVTIETAGEECFTRNATLLSRMEFSFHVVEGGSLDSRIIDPDGQVIGEFQRETVGNHSVEVDKDGVYTFCFSNIMTSALPKVVEFTIEVVTPPPSKEKIIRIEPMETHCLTENVTVGSQMKLYFVVVEGGYLDIDFVLTDPDGVTLYSVERSSGDNYEFVTDKKGAYKYCFGNEMSTFTERIVEYRIEVVPPDGVQERWITIEPTENHCFTKNVTSRTEMKFRFVVPKGNISFQISAPRGDRLYSGDQEWLYEVELTADEDGRYTYCLSNNQSSQISVWCRIEVVDPPPRIDRTARSVCNIMEENLGAWSFWSLVKPIFC